MSRWVAIAALLGITHAVMFRTPHGDVQAPAVKLSTHNQEALKMRQQNKQLMQERLQVDAGKFIPTSHAHEGCLADNEDRKLNDKGHFAWRDSLLQYVQPWKYEKETLRKYQTDPKIKKVFYINGYDDNRANFMEDTLKYAEHIPHEKFNAVTRGEVQGMQVNGGVPQECWSYSSGGMAPYLKAMDIDDVQGTVGVYLSHARMLEKLKNEDGNSTDIYAVMEDDTGLDPNWDQTVLDAVKALPPDWDIARLVYWGGKRCQDAVPYFAANQTKTLWYEALGPDFLSNVNMYAGNQAYLIRPKSVEAVMKTLRDLPVMDFDGAVGSNHQLYQEKVEGKKDPITINWGLYTYVLETPVGRHTDLGSQRVTGKKTIDPWGETGERHPQNQVAQAFGNPWAAFR